MTRLIASALALGLFVLLTSAAEDVGPAKGVKKVEAAFEPAEAKPGQTVTLKITVELLDGYHTYPTKQVDKNAAQMVNKITFPAPAGVIFVGETKDPANPDTKAEPEIGIKELRTYGRTVVYERKAIVSPTAAPGERAVKVKSFKLLVCDANTCFPPKTLTPEARLKVLDGPAVAVEKDFQDEVKKALDEKK